MIASGLVEVRHRTPLGRRITLAHRPGSHDEETARAVCDRDEYRLREILADLDGPGFALDIGAYTGAVSVALAVDWGLHVIAVEPIPPNVGVIRSNTSLNAVEGLVTVDERAAGLPGWNRIEWGYEGSHAFVGNLGEGAATTSTSVRGVTLGDLLATYEIPRVALLKIDCEGCEWRWLLDPATLRCERIVGETHGRPLDDLVGLLPCHDVTALDDYQFHARLRT